MRVRQTCWLVLAVALTGCGSDKPTVTLSVTCGGNVALVGARSIDVLGDPVNGRTMISFPDPVNPGKTSTLVVAPHGRCSISPVMGNGG